MSNDDINIFTSPLNGNVSDIKKLKNAGMDVPIWSENLTRKICKWWNDNVQPVIDKNYPERADCGWDWSLLYCITKLSTGLYPIEGRVLFGAIKNEKGYVQIPIGLMIACPKAKFVAHSSGSACFLWFLASLPESLYPQFGVDRLKPAGRALVDVALCRSFRERYWGRVCLHADPAGGEQLMSWYKKIGMKVLDGQNSLRGGRRWMKNDGRYLYYDVDDAITVYDYLSSLRCI